jgi:acyl carrier protein
MATQRDAERTVRAFIRRVKNTEAVDLESNLFATGVGLNSLETAELSAILEDELGSDPFAEGELPQTVAEVIAFYDADGNATAQA